MAKIYYENDANIDLIRRTRRSASSASARRGTRTR